MYPQTKSTKVGFVCFWTKVKLRISGVMSALQVFVERQAFTCNGSFSIKPHLPRAFFNTTHDPRLLALAL